MIRLLASAALALALVAAPARADRTIAQTAALSAELYLAGLEARDPLLVLAAARLRKSVALSEVARAVDKDMPEPEDPPMVASAAAARLIASRARVHVRAGRGTDHEGKDARVCRTRARHSGPLRHPPSGDRGAVLA